jgi:hypothetical protein
MGGLVVAHFQAYWQSERRVKKLVTGESGVAASRYNLVCGGSVPPVLMQRTGAWLDSLEPVCRRAKKRR